MHLKGRRHRLQYKVCRSTVKTKDLESKPERAVSARRRSLTWICRCSAEKGESRPAGGGKTEHPGQKDSGGKDEETDAEGRVLEEERGGGALEDGDEVRSGPAPQSGANVGWCF